LRGLEDRRVISQLFFATAAPAYADKTNATAVHAALQLPVDALAVDMVGAVRSGVGALVAASQSRVPTMAVLSDVRTGLPGGADERDGGDGAAAFVFADDTRLPVLAELLSHASSTEEFLDRWRLPGAANSRVWEERFGEEIYTSMLDDTVSDALKHASLSTGDIDHLIVAGLHARAVRHAAKAIGVRPEAVVDDLVPTIGNSGTAQAGVLLADVLDRAGANERILLVVLADGVSAFVLQTTAALAEHRQRRSVAAQIAAGNSSLSYATFLSWRGFLDREPPPPGARTGSSDSSQAAALSAVHAACRPRASAHSAERPTRWCPSRWPESAAPSRRTRSITSHTPRAHPCWSSLSISRAADDSAASSPTPLRTRSRSGLRSI
jgi:3-hydroxy-3-methylglutaryl CoA synthase